jgi:anaerobic magnesium-protoporphyrin IX monomethyl ester cyclase
MAHALEGRDEWDESDVDDILASVIKETQPRVVGVSNLYTFDHPDCLRILESCKKIDESIVTVIGGPHVTFQDEICLRQSPYVDVVVRGEGEWTMLDLVSALKTGRDLESVEGITFRRNGALARNPDRPLGDLSELAPIDFGLLPAEFVKKANIHGVSNRGCAYRCTYCVESAFWKRKREHTVQSLLHEIMTLKKEYGTFLKGFFESMIDTESLQFLELTTELMKHKVALPPRFYIHARPDCITTAAIDALEKSGISKVNLGVESGSPTVRKKMGRPMSNDVITDTCTRLRRKNIEAHTYWIIGHPGDNPQESELSLTYLDELYKKDLTTSSDCMMFLPYPGTRFFESPQKHGVEISSMDWAGWNRFHAVPPAYLTAFSAEEIHTSYKRFRRRAQQGRLVNLFT